MLHLRFLQVIVTLIVPYNGIHKAQSFLAPKSHDGAASFSQHRRLYKYHDRHHPVTQTTALHCASRALTDHAPSWEALREEVLKTSTGKQLQQEALDRAKGLGPPHTDAPFRLFDNDLAAQEKDIRVTLYRDQAAWCPYCQKVWLYLEEKCIPYRVQKVPMNAYGDKPAWYTRLVDGGKLPAVEIDGTLYVESLDITRTLESMFADHGPVMIPEYGTEQAKRMNHLLQLEQELQSAWFSLTFYPVEGDALAAAQENFLDVLRRVDLELGLEQGLWFLEGKTPSLVDISFITQVERIVPSVLYWKGLSIRNTGNFPHLDQWLNEFDQRPAYRASKSDFYTHVMVMPSQNGPGYMIPEAKSIATQMCGITGGSWELPLDLERHIETMSFSSDNACYEAAYRLVENHANVVTFACRGAGEPGRPSFHAELSDPYAEPNLDYVQAVDVSLRHVVCALLHGVNATSSAANQDLKGNGGTGELRENWEAFADDDIPSLTYYYNWETGDSTWTPPTCQLDTCIMYLRDRIGVPRDMSAAAAMQLRVHINWAVELMQQQ